MTDETKAQLKQYADAKHGRKNLKSLDKTLGLVGFDKVQDADGERPKVTLRADGYMGVWDHSTHPTIAVAPYRYPTRFNCIRVKRETIASHCPWVRLKYYQPWQVEELANRWPSRKIAVKTYQGDTVTVHPVDVVIAWFRFLWPEPEEWGERAVKYLVGFTEKYTVQCPGVGARFRFIETEASIYEDGNEAAVHKINSAGHPLIYQDIHEASRPRAVYEIPELAIWGRDKWEILG